MVDTGVLETTLVGASAILRHPVRGRSRATHGGLVVEASTRLDLRTVNIYWAPADPFELEVGARAASWAE